MAIYTYLLNLLVNTKNLISQFHGSTPFRLDPAEVQTEHQYGE